MPWDTAAWGSLPSGGTCAGRRCSPGQLRRTRVLFRTALLRARLTDPAPDRSKPGDLPRSPSAVERLPYHLRLDCRAQPPATGGPAIIAIILLLVLLASQMFWLSRVVVLSQRLLPQGRAALVQPSSLQLWRCIGILLEIDSESNHDLRIAPRRPRGARF